jgi:hypothetical protein
MKKGRYTMRYSKIIILPVIVLTVITLSGACALGQTINFNPSGPLLYHEFQVADLGLQGAGRGTRDFKIKITAPGGADQAVTVKVEDANTNELLVTGSTDSVPQVALNGSWFMGQLDDKFGGDFEIEDQAETLYDKVLATGLLPRGRYLITVGLSPAGSSGTLEVIIVPPYVQPLFPVDMQTTRALLDFRWVSNIQRQELHIYTDPAGNREVLEGSRLPYTKIGGSAQLGNPQKEDVAGSIVAPVLENGRMYYWQIHGYVITSHGNERRESVLTAFQYFEKKEDIEYIGLSDPDKKAIMDALILLLKEVMGKQGERAAKSLDQYEVNRVTMDQSPVSREEIISILQEIIAGRATATAISFQ